MINTIDYIIVYHQYDYSTLNYQTHENINHKKNISWYRTHFCYDSIKLIHEQIWIKINTKSHMRNIFLCFSIRGNVGADKGCKYPIIDASEN